MRKLEYYGGDGYGGLNEVGNYDVNYSDENGNEQERNFKSLSEAREFFDSINNEKAFWDCTRGAELIDAYYVVD